MLLAACSPQTITTLAPTPASTNTLAAPPTLQPTQTLEPTPVPKQLTKIPVESCSQLMDATISSTGALEVIYSYTKGIPYEPPQGFSGSARTNNIQLWSWSEDHPQKAAAYPLPSDAVNPQIAPDHNWIIFQRVFGKMKRELWVIDANGQNEKKLASLSFDDVRARNPTIEYASLEYGWIPHMDTMYYKVKLSGKGIRENPPMYDAFALIDIHSGKTIPLVQSGTVNNIVFAPDGSQVAILTPSKSTQAVATLSNGADLRLVNTSDGSEQFILPLQLRSDFLTYSPDGKYALGLSYDSIVSMNVRAGTAQKIPLNYPLVSGTSPKFTWVNNSTLLAPMTDLPEGVREINDNELRQDANPSFTVWRINLMDTTALPVQTFKGYAGTVNFSVDGNYLSFIQDLPPGKGQAPGGGKFAVFRPLSVKLVNGAPTTDLLLADLNTGNILTTVTADKFFAWSPYPDLYVYAQSGNYVDGIYPFGVFLGEIERDPIFIKLEIGNPWWRPRSVNVIWVDPERFTMNVGCEINLISLAR